MCINWNNQLIIEASNLQCSINSIISIHFCIFFGLNYNRKALDGGAIYCSVDSFSSIISNNYFNQCRGKNGGVLYFNLCKQNILFSNCYFNCSSSVYGQVFYIRNKDDFSFTQNNLSSILYCPWNLMGNCETFDLVKGSAIFSNLNNSNSEFTRWICNYPRYCKNYLEFYCTYSNHKSSIIIAYAYNYNSQIKLINVLNNTKGPDQSYNCFIFDYGNVDTNLTESIFYLNKGYLGKSLLYSNNLKVFNNYFYDNDIILSNISQIPTIYSFYNQNTCHSNQNQSKMKKFNSYKLLFLLYNYLI